MMVAIRHRTHVRARGIEEEDAGPPSQPHAPIRTSASLRARGFASAARIPLPA
jgi:hypothetical protein